MNGFDFVNQGARRGGLIGGLTGAATGAAIGGLGKTYRDPSTGKKMERTGKQRLIGGALGAAGLGYVGHATGMAAGAVRNAVKWNSGFRPSPPRPPMPDWLKGAKNKAEARRAYHKQSRKVHPDLGGSVEAQKDLNNEWAKHESFFKEAALLRGFANELEKIAAVRSYASR